MDARTRDEIVVPGAVGGVVAGMSAMTLALLASAISGAGLLRPLELVGAALFRDPGDARGGGAVVAGLVLHLLTSAALGIIYNALVPRGVSYAQAALFGLLFGAFVFVFVTWLVLPWLDRLLFESVPAVWSLVYHLIFGAIVPLAVALRRSVAAGSMPRSDHLEA